MGINNYFYSCYCNNKISTCIELKNSTPVNSLTGRIYNSNCFFNISIIFIGYILISAVGHYLTKYIF